MLPMNVDTSVGARIAPTDVGCVTRVQALALSRLPTGLSIPLDGSPHRRHTLSNPLGCL
jgi:hypothetical protein